MAKTNGYFQQIIKDDKTYVRLFPPVEGGQPISINELLEYLAKNDLLVDKIALNTTLAGLEAPKDFLITDKKTFPVAERFELKVSDDKMQAVVRFYPASNGGSVATSETIINDLKFKGIKFGIDAEELKRYLSDKKYCTDYVIAKGQPPKQGSDASIEYFFNTDPNTKPTLNDDGTVDFFNLNTISKCNAGQLLARLTPEVPGERGMNVLGEPLLPRDVRKLMLKHGANISMSDDGFEITADVNGHVSLVDDKVFVSNVYEVTDVDTATGNIDYEGNVLVTGNVKAGFTVKSRGNVEVRGVVEGAEVDADGDIIIARGMNGMGRGVLNAGGNVIAKFIENSTVNAGGYIQSEAILHSHVSAKGDINVSGKKGFITGGEVRALGVVTAKVIGSEMGADTEVEVGIDPTLKNRITAITNNIADIKKSIEKVEPVLATMAKKVKEGSRLTMDQTRYFNQLSAEYKKLKEELQAAMDEYDQVSDELENLPSESYIEVSHFAYPGCKFTISEVPTYIKTTTQHCRFVRDGADIRMKPI